MIVKKTNQLRNFKKGINLYVPARRSAPSGILVASANSVVMNLTRYGSSSTLTLVKKSTQGEFLGNSSGSGDVFYLVSGIIYKFVNIISGTDYGSEFLVAPNASIGSDSNNADWIGASSYWRIFQFYSDDGLRYAYFGYNSSTSTTTIPTIGWILDPQGDTYVTALSITAAPEIGSDNPANATEPDATAWVLMDGPFYNTPGNAGSGFVGGQSWRKMQPAAAVNGRASYVYGDEGVNWTGTQWQYTNTGRGVITSSSSNVAFPWLATAWTSGYSATKITSTYVKTTNYPAVP